MNLDLEANSPGMIIFTWGDYKSTHFQKQSKALPLIVAVFFFKSGPYRQKFVLKKIIKLESFILVPQVQIHLVLSVSQN